MRARRLPAQLRRLLGGFHRSSKTFRRNVAILITLASVAAAAAAYRAEDRARVAEEQDREGFAQDVALEQAKAQIYSNLEDVVIDYAQARALRAEQKALEAQARKAAPDEAAVLRVEADAVRQRAGGILGGLNPDAFVEGSDGTRITDESLTSGPTSKYAVDIAFQQTSQDLDSRPEYEEADRSFTKSDLDVGFAALAIAAAFFFTLAQSSRTRATYVFLVGGAATLVVSIVLLLTVELV